MEVYTGGHKYFQRFERGKQVTDLQDLGPSEDPNRTGTTVRFLADPEIFKETTVYNFDTLQTRLREQAFLNAGIHIELTDLRGEEPVQHNFCYQGGVSSFVEYINKKKAVEVIHPDVMHFTAVALRWKWQCSIMTAIMSFCCRLPTIFILPMVVPMRMALSVH